MLLCQHMAEPIEEHYSPKEVAARLHVSERTVWRWIAARLVTYVKIGGAVRIKQTELQRVLRESQVRRLPSTTPLRSRLLASGRG